MVALIAPMIAIEAPMIGMIACNNAISPQSNATPPSTRINHTSGSGPITPHQCNAVVWNTASFLYLSVFHSNCSTVQLCFPVVIKRSHRELYKSHLVSGWSVYIRGYMLQVIQRILHYRRSQRWSVFISGREISQCPLVPVAADDNLMKPGNYDNLRNNQWHRRPVNHFTWSFMFATPLYFDCRIL